ncbi:MAG: FKBP-type peptidyl-prolyl cis-trans isomerase [Candidatus Acidiferrales bacterium]
MRKIFARAIGIVAVGLMALGCTQAQTSSAGAQTPASPPPAAKTPATKSTTPAARSSTGAKPPVTAGLQTDLQKASYALGINIGTSIKQQPIQLDLPSLFKGIKDAEAGTKPVLTEDEMNASLKVVRDEAAAKVSEANMKEGGAFLAANKAKDGVVTTASGLQYKIITAGTGAKPTNADTVVCNYKGTFINGTEFDSSYKRGKPAEFPVGGVIPGWTEALQLMSVGSKWELYVPSELAYGSRGAGGAIGPNQTLIFEVELLSIKPKQ